MLAIVQQTLLRYAALLISFIYFFLLFHLNNNPLKGFGADAIVAFSSARHNKTTSRKERSTPKLFFFVFSVFQLPQKHAKTSSFILLFYCVNTSSLQGLAWMLASQFYRNKMVKCLQEKTNAGFSWWKGCEQSSNSPSKIQWLLVFILLLTAAPSAGLAGMLM